MLPASSFNITAIPLTFLFLVPTSNGHIGPSLVSPPTINHLLNSGAQQLLQSLPQMLTNPHAPPQPPLMNQPPLLPTSSPLLQTPSVQSTTRLQHNMSPLSVNSYPESKLHPQSLSKNCSPPASRMTTSNGELTVTTSHGPNSSQGMKRSPSSLSPSCNEGSTADLLADSPSKCIKLDTVS